LNISWPDAADVLVTGTFFMVGCAFAATHANKTNAIVSSVTTLDAMRVSFSLKHANERPSERWEAVLRDSAHQRAYLCASRKCKPTAMIDLEKIT
jgi:hypothetical protein